MKQRLLKQMIPALHVVSAEANKNITSPAPGSKPIPSGKSVFNS
jgi:hypothetical protein